MSKKDYMKAGAAVLGMLVLADPVYALTTGDGGAGNAGNTASTGTSGAVCSGSSISNNIDPNTDPSKPILAVASFIGDSISGFHIVGDAQAGVSINGQLGHPNQFTGLGNGLCNPSYGVSGMSTNNISIKNCTVQVAPAPPAPPPKKGQKPPKQTGQATVTCDPVIIRSQNGNGVGAITFSGPVTIVVSNWPLGCNTVGQNFKNSLINAIYGYDCKIPSSTSNSTSGR